MKLYREIGGEIRIVVDCRTEGYVKQNNGLQSVSKIFRRSEAAYLFGSHAVNRIGRWSDIDVAVVSPDFSSDRFDARLRLMKLSTEIDTRIEPVPYHINDFQETDPLVAEIKKQGVRLTT